MTIRLVVFVLMINLVLITCDSRFCYSQQTCDKCLDHDSECSWCSDDLYNMKRSRCMTRKDLKDAKCREKYIETNKYEDVQITKADELRDFDKDSDSVQIKPQNVKMKLRKSRQQKITMNYKPARNYPLDLYYLMDLSWTMRDDKKTLVGMGGSLSESLSNLTKNFRLGFGSFADKPIMPFINPGSEKNPCDLVHDNCLPTYGFKHKLGLTDDIQQFVSKVNSSEITANLDNLEGGLDALMQILVCRDEIGWNDKTRKMVVFATDGPMHVAGDGLLAGLVKKNDKSCHLNDQGDYMASLDFDYPSLEEIYRELLKTKISVIFAVTSEVIYHYDQIYELMKEVTSVDQLATDSSNILQLVEKGYTEAVKRAQFQDNAPSYIQMEYKTTCGGKYESLQDTSKCDNIEIGNEYIFEVGVTLLDYPEDGTKNLKIKVEEANIDSEALEIDIEIDYPCKTCTSLPGEPAAALCSRHGELKCGSCVCDEGFAGKQCECSLQDYSSTKELDNQCRSPIVLENNSTQLSSMCMDRGECLCGECICNVPFEGTYCECEPCPIYNEKVCGGNGDCICGECKCKAEFSGRTCECSSLQTNCIAPNNENSEPNKVCSGHGSCVCNQCECDTGRFGNFCEGSPGNETLNSLCIFYEPCVQCVINRKLERECSDFRDKCSSKNGALYKSEFYDDISDASIQCIARVRYDDETVCEYKFTYDQEGSDTNLSIADTKCPPVNVAAFTIIGIIIATFLIGFLIMMVVKVNMYLIDKREFAKFEEERLQTEYRYESPIYKSPVTIFRNPQKNRESQNDFELQ